MSRSWKSLIQTLWIERKTCDLLSLDLTILYSGPFLGPLLVLCFLLQFPFLVALPRELPFPASYWPKQDSIPSYRPCPISVFTSKTHSLQPKNGGSVILKNGGILPWNIVILFGAIVDFIMAIPGGKHNNHEIWKKNCFLNLLKDSGLEVWVSESNCSEVSVGWRLSVLTQYRKSVWQELETKKTDSRETWVDKCRK